MKQITYDVVVIGGGPAGSSVASVLAKAGHQVLVLEKQKFPREHVGESLLPFCYQIFEELGVLEEMKTRFLRKPGVTFSNTDGSHFSNWCFHHVIDDPSQLSFHVHRATFDDLLLKNSRRHGAEVMEETKVLKVDFGEEETVVRAVGPSGENMDITARYVIDASGQATVLAKQLGCKKPFDRLERRVALSNHWENAKLDPSLKTGNIKIVHLEGEHKGWFWLIPITENRLSIGLAVDMAFLKAQKKQLSEQHKDWQTAFYLQVIQSSPAVASIIEGANMLHGLNVNGDFSYYTEHKYNERYATVGDASAFLDPIFSSGIYLGMRGGQLVGEGVSQLLNTGKREKLDKAYVDISGAYRLVEELIVTFYEPGSIRFAEVDKVLDFSYEKFEAAYSILHLVLAGDFFTNYDKYLKAIQLLKDEEMIDKYRNLIGHPEVHHANDTCVVD
ncbi:MAG: NAD(P)/FAD-dependent oxidoreductase [Bacteroidota bacterium]